MKQHVNNELGQLLDAVFERYGYDFREYSMAHVRRRLDRWVHQQGKRPVPDLVKIIHEDDEAALSLIKSFSIGVTSMFRDPPFFKAVREKVFPILETYPFTKIWHAGCATGEEVYSMAILLNEAGLLGKSRMYATDFNDELLSAGREGIYAHEKMLEYEAGYHASNGKHTLKHYYTSRYGSAIMRQWFRQHIVWANHNLVTDHVFNEVNMVVCRNVLIYFSKPLQDRALRLFYESLVNNGVLCLGVRESVKFTSLEPYFRVLDTSMNIYQKKPA